MKRTGIFISALLCSLFLSSCISNLTGNKDKQVFSGTIETQEIRVGSKAGGRVAEVLVREGDIVEPGQVLVKLDVSELQSQQQQAQARIDQQRARLERLLNGARSQELAQAQAQTEAARANLDAVRNWPRPEEIAQARASVNAAEADLNNAQAAFQRAQKLHTTGDISQQELDAAKFRLENLQARRDAEKKRLDLLLNGSRREDIRAAESRYEQARAAEQLLRAGARSEEIADARAQLSEAQARLEQIKVQVSEGEVKSPAKAVVESLPVRPGDLLTQNQTVAKLLESDQLWVRIYVPETQLASINVGQKVKVTIDEPGQVFDGEVEQINSQAEFTPRNVQSRDERNHQVFGVKVRVRNANNILKSGMAADVATQQ
ncbi:MAG TPA: efflux RND transporter periplasmic adaptor subunit [Blastocatellia bacterium]|nr:efflux RND transporter periplasmic adaptor subunit [Blastocatellia bacterium]